MRDILIEEIQGCVLVILIKVFPHFGLYCECKILVLL